MPNNIQREQHQLVINLHNNGLQQATSETGVLVENEAQCRARHLANIRAIKQSKTPVFIDFSANLVFSDENFLAYTKPLIQCAGVNISSNDVSLQQWVKIGELITQPSFEKLNASAVLAVPGSENLPGLTAVLNQGKYLTKLDISNNFLANLCDEAFNTFCKALSHCRSLQHLNLSGNDIGTMSDERIEHLLDTIADFKKLRHLDLSGNSLAQLSEQTQQKLGQCFEDFKLISLDLSHNEISQHLINKEMFFAEVAKNRALTSLIMIDRNHNHVTSSDLETHYPGLANVLLSVNAGLNIIANEDQPAILFSKSSIVDFIQTQIEKSNSVDDVFRASDLLHRADIQSRLKQETGFVHSLFHTQGKTKSWKMVLGALKEKALAIASGAPEIANNKEHLKQIRDILGENRHRLSFGTTESNKQLAHILTIGKP